MNTEDEPAGTGSVPRTVVARQNANGWPPPDETMKWGTRAPSELFWTVTSTLR